MQRSSESNPIIQHQLAKERRGKNLEVESSGACCDTLTDAVSKNHPDCLMTLWKITQSPEEQLNIKLPNLKKEQPLHIAAYYNSSAMIVSLERKGMNVNCLNQQLLTPLHIIANTYEADLEAVRYLLLKGANANLEDANGRIPLHYAALTGNVEVAKMLLPHSNVNTVGAQGETPLLLAALESRPDLLQFLLENGADPRATTIEKGTALHFAALKSDLKSMEVLLKYSVDINARDLEGSAPLHIACMSNSLECAKLLIDHGAKINEMDKEYVSPLHHAAHKGNVELVKLLIQKGADPFATTNSAITPLAMAAMSGSAETLKEFISHGVPVNTQDLSGETPMHHAARTGDVELVRAILKKKQFTDVRNNQGETPLLIAAKGNHLEAVRALAEDGADANAIDGKGVAPLHEACIHGNSEMVKLLLRHRANPNEENLDKDTPLTLALKRIHMKSAPFSACAYAVLDAGADTCAQNELGLAPLHYAAKHGMVKWVQLLLKRGADKTAKDVKGKTPYDIAKTNNRPQCAKLLELNETPT